MNKGMAICSSVVVALSYGIFMIVITTMPTHMTLADPHGWDWALLGGSSLICLFVGLVSLICSFGDK